MLTKSFKPAKCKTSLKLAVARIKLLRNKRGVEVKKMRTELAQLLESGQEQTALIRVEHVIREEKIMSAYELIELFCELIVARLPIIESQKSCPIDMKEAVCSVIFASPRCADLPELMDVCKHFKAKYGKEFVHSALEVRIDCGVSHMVVEKLSTLVPDAETKIKSLIAIAQEHNVKWRSKTFDEQLKKPHDDLLNGPTDFSSASKLAMEFYSMKSATAPRQLNESRVAMLQNDSATRPTAFSTFSGTTTRNNSSVPFTSQDSRTLERRSQGREINNSYPREDNASLNRPTWNMEFEDATTAAQAAAESAERASFAARAAADLASRGHMSRQNSTASNESSTYSNKYERPEKLRELMGKNADDESISKGSESSDEINSSQGIKNEVKHEQEERVQGISRREAARTSDNDYSTGLRSSSRSLSRSSQGFVNDILDSNLQKDDPKDYSHAQGMSSASEAVEPNRKNMKYESVESSQENINVDSIKEYPYNYVNNDEKLLNSNIYKHETDEVKTSRMGSFGNKHKQSTSGDSSVVVFYDYDSDDEDNILIFGKKGGNLFDPYQGEELSTFQCDKVPSSVDQIGSGSIAKNRSPQLRLLTKAQTEEHSEPMTNGTYPSEPAFDVSDGESRESEGECTSGSNHTYMGKSKEVRETIRNSGAYDGKNRTVLDDADKFYSTYDSGSLPNSQPSLRSDKVPSNSNLSVSVRAAHYNSSEEPQPLLLTKRQPPERTEAKEKPRMQLTHLDNETSNIPKDLNDEGGQGINFGRLIGGFKQKGFPRPPYIMSSAVDSSHFSKQSSDKQAARFEVAGQERSSQQSYLKACASKSRTSGASIDSHSETVERVAANFSAEDTYDTDKKHFVPQNAKITDVDVPTQELYYPKSHRKSYKEISLNFQGDDPLINEQTHYARHYTGSDSNQQQQRIDISSKVDKAQLKSSRESSSRMALDSDASEAKLDPNYIAGSRVKLSRRTRDEPSQSKSSFSGVTGPLSNTNNDAVTVQEEVSSNKPEKKNPSPSRQTSAILKESSKSQLDSTDNRVLRENGNTKSSVSSGDSVSRESSLKKASYTHPKLPDYDSLAAHFHSLRSNRQ